MAYADSYHGPTKSGYDKRCPKCNKLVHGSGPDLGAAIIDAHRQLCDHDCTPQLMKQTDYSKQYCPHCYGPPIGYPGHHPDCLHSGRRIEGDED